MSLHFSLNTSVPVVTHGRTRETKKYRNTRKQLCMNSARNIFGIAERSSSFAKTLLWCHSSVGWNKAMGRGPLGEWWSLNVDGFGRRRRKGIVERPNLVQERRQTACVSSSYLLPLDREENKTPLFSSFSIRCQTFVVERHSVSRGQQSYIQWMWSSLANWPSACTRWKGNKSILASRRIFWKVQPSTPTTRALNAFHCIQHQGYTQKGGCWW